MPERNREFTQNCNQKYLQTVHWSIF